MVISSIDLKDGSVVQLKNGKDLLLKRDDAQSLIYDFNSVGEVAIIDLDAALRNTLPNGDTANTPLLKSLLRQGDVRVGGGIRNIQKAKELISLGAQKVIIGSAAWVDNAEDKDNILNVSFLEELKNAIGKERIIISVDSIKGFIATHGWIKTTNIPLINAAKAAQEYAGEILWTCVEKEGCLHGTNMEQAKELRNAVDCRVTVAGGVSSIEEITLLSKIGCDVQLGMALYTGRVNLKEAFVNCLAWQKGDLLPVIAQSVAGEVLMLGYANREAFTKTFETGNLTFYSRSRKCLWTKGETSGNLLKVIKLRADCDHDTILATVEPLGPTCHTGAWTCFTSEAIATSNLERLYSIIKERLQTAKPESYTASLDNKRVREKIMEEAQELCEGEGKDEIIWEAADLIYFISVLLAKENVTWQAIFNELDRRHKK